MIQVQREVFVHMTPEQRSSLVAVIGNRSKAPKQVYMEILSDCIMVEFEDIVIGIEADGYTHS